MITITIIRHHDVIVTADSASGNLIARNGQSLSFVGKSSINGPCSVAAAVNHQRVTWDMLCNVQGDRTGYCLPPL